MKKSLLLFIVLVFGITFLMDGFRSAFAQEGDQEEFVLDEITVTAQKREQSLLEVPISVSVTTSDQLERQLVYSMRDLERTTPALEFGNTGPGGTPTIRGIGTATMVGAGEPSVGLNVDGVSQGGAIINLFDVQRVEVLRGPQGTLYGDTATAGFINIITNAPDPAGFSAKVGLDITDDGTLGSKYSRHQYRGMMNVPINENSAVRGVYNFDYMKGLTKNKLGPDEESKNHSVRINYLYEPTDDFSMRLIGNYLKGDSIGRAIFTAVRSTSAIHQEALASCGITASFDNQYACHDFDVSNKTESYGLSAEFDFKAFGHEITSITSYSENETGPFNWEVMGIRYPGLFSLYSHGAETSGSRYTTDLRINSPKDQKVEYMVGLWYNGGEGGSDKIAYTEMYLAAPILPFPPYVIMIPSNGNLSENNNKNYAVYANADIHFTDAFTVFAGARVSRYDIWTSTTNMQEPELPGDPPIGFRTVASIEKDYFSYRLGGQYDINEDWMVYFNTSNAVKTPVVTEPPFTDPNAPSKIIDAEVSTNYEIGTKGKIFEGKMVLESNIFYTIIEDFQGNDCYLSNETQQLSCTAANVRDKIYSKGFEINLYGFPMFGLRVNTGYIYNIAEYPEPYGSDDNPPVDIGGTQLINAPKHKFVISTEYSHSLTNNVDGFVSVDATYRTKRRLSKQADPFAIYPAHWMVGGRIGIRAQENWDIALFARNLFGEPAPAQSWPDPEGNDVQCTTPAQFRQVGLSMNYSF